MLEEGTGFRYKRLVMKCGYTDLRCGIATLTLRLGMLYGVDWNENDVLYLFCGRSCRKVRGLVHTEDGFIMINVQLDTLRVKWPRNSDDLREITPEQFAKVLRGERI